MRVLKKEIWPYSVDVERHDAVFDRNGSKNRSLEEWCESVFGRRFEKWYSYNLTPTMRTFAFKEEADLLIFKLRGR